MLLVATTVEVILWFVDRGNDLDCRERDCLTVPWDCHGGIIIYYYQDLEVSLRFGTGWAGLS